MLIRRCYTAKKSPMFSILRRSRHTSPLGGAVSARDVRRQFLDHFTASEGHQFVRSSPVVPLNDPSLTFVNAGMNQFKGVFQGACVPPSARVVNSQRCVRVGGKHNDLEEVGRDGWHHTMFEMLGNWSFGDYWKFDSCRMAWHLLIDVFKLDPSRLYVTYFSGCPDLGLPPDNEVCDVWRRLGVRDDHLVPGGVEDNFWEMGVTGPCGPCTEIHYDHGGSGAAAVNRGLADNVEIWNIVFMEYERKVGGGLENLPNKHIDTGMGLERITAVMNNSTSNYDTGIVLNFATVLRTTNFVLYL